MVPDAEGANWLPRGSGRRGRTGTWKIFRRIVAERNRDIFMDIDGFQKFPHTMIGGRCQLPPRVRADLSP